MGHATTRSLATDQHDYCRVQCTPHPTERAVARHPLRATRCAKILRNSVRGDALAGRSRFSVPSATRTCAMSERHRRCWAADTSCLEVGAPSWSFSAGRPSPCKSGPLSHIRPPARGGRGNCCPLFPHGRGPRPPVRRRRVETDDDRNPWEWSGVLTLSRLTAEILHHPT